MPEPAILIVGALVTLVALMACRAAGQLDEEGARDQERDRLENASK